MRVERRDPLTPTLHAHGVVDSTNDVAQRMAREGAPEGTAVTAQRQLKGRGRRGRAWLDEPGASVLMSIILRPGTPRETHSQLSFVVSLAVAEYLRSAHGIDAMLKWPNDVLANGRKIAGILLELEPHGGAVVVGIGVNVNQQAFPVEIASTATSVVIETGTERDTAQAAEELARATLSEYEAYLRSGFEDIRKRWLKYMWGFGRQAEVHTEGRVITGRIVGIDRAGALVLRESSGVEHAVHAADAVNLVTDGQEAT